jgi:hypothetical protein
MSADTRGDVAMPMEPNEIFELIIKADEKLKYAKPGKGDVRAQQAADLLSQAKNAAEEIGNEALLQQVRVRQADLDALFATGDGAQAESSGD